MFCPKCEKQIPDDSVFCENCGVKIKRKSQKTAVIIAAAVLLVLAGAAAMYFISNLHRGGDIIGKKSMDGADAPDGAAQIQSTSAAAVSVSMASGNIWLDSDDEGGTDAPATTGFAASTSSDASESSGESTSSDESTSTAAAESDKTSADHATAPATDFNEADDYLQGIVDISDDDLLDMASGASTDEIATFADIEWFFTYMDGSFDERMSLMENWSRVYDIPLILNGGWKACICSSNDIRNPDMQWALNIEISTDGDKFEAVTNWNFAQEEPSTSYFSGSWDEITGTASLQSDFATIKFDDFYIIPYHTFFAVGKIHWNSGEVDYIVMTR